MQGSGGNQYTKVDASAHKAITRLSSHVAAQIRSSITINSLTDVVSGLVENSLDSRATEVNVSIDFIRGSCAVQDNGHGIHPADFGQDGGLAQTHYTSKATSRSANLHGGNGVFLASVSAASLLSITSKHHSHNSTNSLLIHQSRVIARHTPVPLAQRVNILNHHGTQVTVRDLFGNMPVRIKHRASTTKSTQDVKKLWSYLRHRIFALILAWPFPVCLVVTNTADPSMRFSIRPPDANRAPSETRNSFRTRAENLPLAFRCLADLPPGAVSAFVPTSASTTGFVIKGSICTVPFATRSLQFISLGVKPVSAESDYGIWFDVVNRAFEHSSFGSDRSNDYNARENGAQETRNKKSLERFPAFYLCVTPRDHSSPPVQIPVQDVDVVSRALATLVNAWLRANYFKSQQHQIEAKPDRLLRSYTTAEEHEDRQSLDSPLVVNDGVANLQNRSGQKRRLDSCEGRGSSNFFAQWSRVKSSDATLKRAKLGERPISTQSNTMASDLPSKDPCRPRAQQLSVGSLSQASVQVVSNSQAQSSSTPDQCIGSRLSVADTGILGLERQRKTSLQNIDATAQQLKPKASSKTMLHSYGRRTVEGSTGTLTDSSARPTDWLSKICQSWKNPVFENEDPDRITSAGFMPATDHAGTHRSNEGIARTPLQLSKRALEHAEVIAQVDRKYILIRVQDYEGSGECVESGGHTLVLVDQHAASERCMLEGLFRETFLNSASTLLGAGSTSVTCVDVTPLARPILFTIPTSEADLLRDEMDHFATWGMSYHFNSSPDTSEDGHLLTVTHLPTTIAERCTIEPKLLIDLIRDEMYSASNPLGPQRFTQRQRPDITTDEKHAWLDKLSSCPRSLIELLNSRACRSAIMFNDELSLAECRSLIAELAQCAFPFICAHGRVSMVPLLGIQEGEGQGLGGAAVDEVDGGSFVRSFRRRNGNGNGNESLALF